MHIIQQVDLPFIKLLEEKGGVSLEHKHLLIIDGHAFHVTLDIVHQAMQIGIDFLALPSHTSHAL